MVFGIGVLEIHPIGDGILSSPCVQHQGGGCSAVENGFEISICKEGKNSNPTLRAKWAEKISVRLES